MLLRNSAERRGALGARGDASRAAARPALGGEAVSGPLLTVRRTILPGEAMDDAGGEAGEDADAQAAPPPKAKLKIRKGGTVAAGQQRTVFDDEGAHHHYTPRGTPADPVGSHGVAGVALEQKLAATFEGIVAEKAKSSSGPRT